MRRLLLILVLLVPSLARAQSTVVSGNVTDVEGQAWAHGFVSVTFVAAPGTSNNYVWSGGAFNVNKGFSAPIDNSGNYTVTLPSNTALTPSNSRWQFVANSGTTADTTSTQTIIVSGGSLTLNFTPSKIRVDAGTTHPVTAYVSNEVKASYGQFFYKITDAHYYVCTVSTSDACTNWVPLCEPGDGFCGGGGTGCTLPGINTGVLSEHPANTCFDSLHWTWDDGASKQNMQAGVGNSAGFTNSYIFGNSNTAIGLTLGFIAGTGNSLVSTDQDVFVIGLSNGGGQALNVNDCFIIGETNRFPGLGNPSTHGFSVDDCGIFGENNSLNFTNAGALGGNPDDIWIVGSNNTLTETSTQSAGALSSIHILGRQNTVTDSTNSVDFVTIAGDRNAIDGAQTTAQILGFDNTLTNVSTGINTSVVGADNTLTNVATATYATVVGNLNILSNCDACYILGQSVHSSQSNSISIGMSAVPGLIISGTLHDNVQRTPSTFINIPACAGGTEGSYAAITDSTVNTWGTTILGSGTNHVLGYCDGTNWTVAAK